MTHAWKGSSTRTPGETEADACQGSTLQRADSGAVKWAGDTDHSVLHEAARVSLALTLLVCRRREERRMKMPSSSRVHNLLPWIRSGWAARGGKSHPRVDLPRFRLYDCVSRRAPRGNAVDDDGGQNEAVDLVRSSSVQVRTHGSQQRLDQTGALGCSLKPVGRAHPNK